MFPPTCSTPRGDHAQDGAALPQTMSTTVRMARRRRSRCTAGRVAGATCRRPAPRSGTWPGCTAGSPEGSSSPCSRTAAISNAPQPSSTASAICCLCIVDVILCRRFHEISLLICSAAPKSPTKIQSLNCIFPIIIPNFSESVIFITLHCLLKKKAIKAIHCIF